MERDIILEELSKLEYWDHISDEDRTAVLDHSELKRFKKGEIVHSADDSCEGVMIVRSGCLRVYLMSEEGKEVTLYRLRDGDVCVLSATCVLSAITFDVFIAAEFDTEVVRTDAAFIRTLSERNIYVKCFNYEASTEKFSDVMWSMQQILFAGLDKRLAQHLWDEYIHDGSVVINTTHDRIASSIGSAREAVTRMLKNFSEEGIVRVFRGGVEILDKDALKRKI